MTKNRVFLIFLLELSTANFLWAIVLSSQSVPEVRRLQKNAASRPAIWQTVDSGQPLLQPSLVVSLNRAMQAEQSDQAVVFIGEVLSVQPAWGTFGQSNCNYVISRTEPEQEIWLLSYFPENDGCVEKGWAVKVEILHCQDCGEDLISVKRLISL